ncbi:DNA primase [Tepidibacillus sp. HK-1]|uniref:DNA primase n=1 Tax=Tepidibacillus sp. HK-1 TaxID=1883407 RepID=UPI0008536582|nr:DNA primase [Tepidibacillus sp. HK-1]GBF10158.1 DNA primase [Tepidibacillus sp. HK-1]
MSSKLIPDEILHNIRRHFDIVDVISQYVQLKKSGRNFVGLCPFHSEKTPSFSVSPEKQIYHCFGCGAGGDVLRFIMEIENFSFREAALHLGQQAGITIPLEHEQTYYDPLEQQKQQMIQVHELASKFYHYLLLETEHGQESLRYLIDRGFTRELIETFYIGYAPSAWDTLKNFLLKRGFAIEILEKAGLIIQSDEGNYYDRFRNRVMFPIFDAHGRVIAFGGRVLDQSLPKYLNSPETLIFNKSKTLYNLHLAKKQIRKKRQAILLEGYVDTIAVWNAGVEQGIATLGTSLTEEHAKILRRDADEVVISYDSDSAGQLATFRAIDILQEVGCQIKIVQMPKGLDPDDYIRKFGAESFKQEILGNTVTATAFKIQYIRKDYNLNVESDRMKYLTHAIDIIADLTHAIEREHYLKGLADEFQLSFDSLKNDLQLIYYEKRKKKEKTRDNLAVKWNNNINNGNHLGRSKTLYPAYYNAEKYLIYFMMKDRQIAEKIQQEIGSGFHVEDFAVLAAYIYSYYGEGNPADISRFLSTLQDQHDIQLATEMAMLDVNEEITEDELNDYIMQVKKYNIEIMIKQKREEQLKAERSNDFAKAAQIGQEIIQLRNKLKWG